MKRQRVKFPWDLYWEKAKEVYFNNKPNPHAASTPGFEPGPHWWEASAHTTAPPLLPKLQINVQNL